MKCPRAFFGEARRRGTKSRGTINGVSGEERYDDFRIAWLAEYLAAVKDAMKEGVDVKGYFYKELIEANGFKQEILRKILKGNAQDSSVNLPRF